MRLTANTWLHLFLDFTDNNTPLAWEDVYSMNRTWVQTRWWVFMPFCLFVCLSIWGGFASARLSICIYCLDNSPQGMLSYPVTPSHSQPRQQTAAEKPLSLICLSSADRELPLGAAMTSQAAWETAWWRRRTVLLSLALIPPTVRLNTKSV